EDATVVVMAAAVADERPTSPLGQKAKKVRGPSTLQLSPTEDILAELGARAWSGARPTLVGFAAETEDVVAHATEKLERKRCDLIVANDVSQSDAGFETETNRVVLVRHGVAPESLPLLSKREVAERILDVTYALRHG